MNDLRNGLPSGGPNERSSSGQQFVQHGSQGIHIVGRRGGRVLSQRLLRRHVAGCSQDVAGMGLIRVGFQSFGQTEIGDLGHVARRQQDVARFEIAMDDSASMRGFDRVGHLPKQRGGAGGRLRLAVNQLAERSAFDELERDVQTVVVLEDVEDLHDVRMLQLRDGFGFGPEAIGFRRRGMCSGEQPLERDQPAQPLMPSLIDDRHTAPPQQLHDVVARHINGGDRQAGHHIGIGIRTTQRAANALLLRQVVEHTASRVSKERELGNIRFERQRPTDVRAILDIKQQQLAKQPLALRRVGLFEIGTDIRFVAADPTRFKPIAKIVELSNRRMFIHRSCRRDVR